MSLTTLICLTGLNLICISLLQSWIVHISMLQYYHYSNIEGCGCWQLIAWLQRGTEYGLNIQICIVLGLAPFKDAGRGGGTRLVWNSFSSDQYKPHIWGVACERCYANEAHGTISFGQEVFTNSKFVCQII